MKLRNERKRKKDSRKKETDRQKRTRKLLGCHPTACAVLNLPKKTPTKYPSHPPSPPPAPLPTVRNLGSLLRFSHDSGPLEQKGAETSNKRATAPASSPSTAKLPPYGPLPLRAV